MTKQLFLAGVIVLALILGTLGATNKIQAARPSTQMAGWIGNGVIPLGVCWKCGT